MQCEILDRFLQRTHRKDICLKTGEIHKGVRLVRLYQSEFSGLGNCAVVM